MYDYEAYAAPTLLATLARGTSPLPGASHAVLIQDLDTAEIRWHSAHWSATGARAAAPKVGEREQVIICLARPARRTATV